MTRETFPDAAPWPAATPLAVRGKPRRIVPLVVGYEPIAEWISVDGGSRFRHLLEPVTAAAIVFDEGWMLVDGGFDPDRVHDADRRRASFDYLNYTPVVPEGDPLRTQIAEAGLEWSSLAGVLLTHAHFDHTGALRLLRADQPVILQRREWEHATSVEDPRMAFVFPDEFRRPDLSFVLLDGDTLVAPGVTVIDTAGHTPGHQSVVVDLPDETVVLAGDAADLRHNIETATPCGSTVGPDGPVRALRAVRRLHILDHRPATTVWPGHDPDWEPWRAVIAGR